MTNQQQSSVWVVIPAAGLGQRMGSSLPKQYLKIQNKTLIEHTLDCFSDHPLVSGIVVVLSASDEYWHSLDLKAYPKPIHTVIGGNNRSDSVMAGLRFLSTDLNVTDDSWVMVHDAARPCLSLIDIDALLAIRSENCIGGLLASPVRDTMKRASVKNNNTESTTVSHTESRENLWHALTPQLFRLAGLTEALQYCQENDVSITDECSAMEEMGNKPLIVEGSHNNIKVTYPSDIEMASFLLNKNTKE